MFTSRKDDFLKYLKGKNLLITSHDLVDLDGFISGLTLKFFFEKFYSNQNIDLIFSGLSKHTKSFLKNFTQKFPDFIFSFLNDEEFLNSDVVIIVDSNNLDQIKLFNNSDLNTPYIFMDHHLNLQKNYSNNLSSLNLIFDNFSSTSEMVLELFNDYNIKLPIPYKYLLVSAILTDSGFLKYGNTETIKNLNTILQGQVEIQDVLPLLEREKDVSEKIARIKALQRVKLIRISDWLIGISHLSSFSASAASLLTKVGFDIGIVVSEDKSDYRITTRAKKQVCLKTGLHLGKIISKLNNVNGGGHDGAATLNGRNDVDETLNQLIDKIKETLIN
ncbi:MAG: DHH family phosphoesterase [Candidatus Lokiarchaeota archaeon]|nr:DHH family phosphoesterase [Candidatus Lokiarchaeota archaeon]